MPRHWIRSFAVEAQKAEQAGFRGTVAIGGVSEGMRPRGVECVKNRALQVDGEQGGFDDVILALLLRQELIALLENQSLYRALDFAGQAFFQVETLSAGLGRWGAIGQAIQWVVTIAAERRFAVCRHQVVL
jgi:hypothetical protein